MGAWGGCGAHRLPHGELLPHGVEPSGVSIQPQRPWCLELEIALTPPAASPSPAGVPRRGCAGALLLPASLRPAADESPHSSPCWDL